MHEYGRPNGGRRSNHWRRHMFTFRDRLVFAQRFNDIRGAWCLVDESQWPTYESEGLFHVFHQAGFDMLDFIQHWVIDLLGSMTLIGMGAMDDNGIWIYPESTHLWSYNPIWCQNHVKRSNPIASTHLIDLRIPTVDIVVFTALQITGWMLTALVSSKARIVGATRIGVTSIRVT